MIGTKMLLSLPFRAGFASLLLLAAYPVCCEAQSVFTERPDDRNAVYLTNEFGAKGNSVADDADALQKAIDRVQETTHRGVVFVPEGRYRIGHTVHVWSGIRLIGYGAKRPVFILGQNTPGFQEGPNRYLLWFTDERTPPGSPIGHASEFTFYSGLLNIDFELKDGNPAAVAVRFNVAQHGFISHSDFHLGHSRAAIEAVGNQANDIRITGGEFGIITGKTSPAWQFLLMDSAISGQRTAAIRTHEAGFTLVRDRFADVPVAIQIPPGEVEQLYGRDLIAENVSHAVLQVGDVRNLRSEITLDNTGCNHVGRFVEGVDLPGTAAASARLSSPLYVEEHFSLGLEIGGDGRERGVNLRHQGHRIEQAARAVPSDIPALPSMEGWSNVHDLGAKGDGATDDTEAIQNAVDTHPVLYFPGGWYRLTASIRLRPGSVLVGFSPFTTQFILADSDSHFQGAGAAVPLLIAPKNGRTFVTGFGIATGNANPRAAGVEWQAGTHSMLEDIDFIRGHSMYVRALASALEPPAPASRRTPMHLDEQNPSLWIHDGGSGVFRGIWSHAGTAKAGLLIENTAQKGVIYQFSCEHHMREEVRFSNAANWRIYALQTEEENPEGADAIALRIESSRNLLFGNTYMYRVSRNTMPKPYAVTVQRSTDITFANVRNFSQTRLAFDNSVFDETAGVGVRAHDFSHFAITPDMRPGTALPVPPVFATGATLTRVAGGFSNASGLTAGSSGTIYFADTANHTIFRYSEGQKPPPEPLAKVERSPMVLGFVPPSTLLAINNEKSVSAIDTTTGNVSPVSEMAAPVPGTSLFLPVGLHNELIQLQWMLTHLGYTYRGGSNTARRSVLLPEHRGYFYAPGTTTAIMAGGTWRPLLQSSQLSALHPGDQTYIVSEDDSKTYVAQFGEGEALATRTFAQRGGTAVVTDSGGDVYMAGSELYVYSKDGRQIGTLEVPERPASLAIGGSDHRTLYIGARRSLYSIRLAASK